jgi:uncharacterized membrane protein (UPF0127 family)
MMIKRFTSAFAGILALTAFSACAMAQSVDPTAPDAVVEYGGPEPLTIETADGPVIVSAQLAETADARQRGLMHRESLGADEGMLFDFQQERVVSIWMDNTLIPLDIIYIRSDGTIAKIITGAVPMSRRQLYSDVPILSVLEVNSGRSAELGIAPGDLVRHRWFGTEADVEATDGNGETTEPAREEPEDG